MTSAGFTVTATVVDGRIDLAARVIPEFGSLAFIQTTVGVGAAEEITAFHRALEVVLMHAAGVLGRQACGGMNEDLSHPESLAKMNAAGAAGEVLRLLLSGLVEEKRRSKTFPISAPPDDGREL